MLQNQSWKNICTTSDRPENIFPAHKIDTNLTFSLTDIVLFQILLLKKKKDDLAQTVLVEDKKTETQTHVKWFAQVY